MFFYPLAKSRLKLHIEKKDWGLGICFTLKLKIKPAMVIHCSLVMLIHCPGKGGTGKSGDLAKVTPLVRNRAGT